MKTLQIDEKNARALYKGASKEFKATLEDTFGKEFFSGKIIDRVKTFEDACVELGMDPEEVKASLDDSGLEEDEKCYRMLKIIIRALNEDPKGEFPDWTDSNQYKYYPWFEFSRSASGFVCSRTHCTGTRTDIGARLCCKSSDLAKYAGTQFIDIYNKYLLAK